MARTVTDEFKALWQAKIRGGDNRERRRIAYWRRYYNGSAFVNESAVQYLYEDEFVAWGEIPWELDSPLQNVYRTGIVTIKLNNERNQWVQSTGTPSFFAADSAASDGYRLFKTLFQLQVGYQLSDSSIEWVNQFTGYALGTKLSTQTAVAEIRVASKAAFLLEKSDAASVSTTITLENCSPATGNGSNVAFKSSSTGVGRVIDLQVNGASLDKTDYVVGNLNTIANPNNDGLATINIDDSPGVVPGVGETVKVTLVKWLQNQSFDDLLTAIALNAGIDSGDLNIDTVIIPDGGSTGSETIDTQSEWEAYLSNSGISTTSTPGSIETGLTLLDNFTDNDYTSSPAWTVAGTVSAAAGFLSLTYHSVANYAWTALAQNTGVWKFRAEFGGDLQMIHFFSSANTYSGGAPNGNGYCLSSILGSLVLQVVNGGTRVTILSLGAVPSGFHEYKITRDSSGTMIVYMDGSSLGTVTNNTYTTSSYFHAVNFGQFDGYTLSVDDIYYGAENAIGVVVYEFNLLSTPTAMGTVAMLKDLNGGTVAVRTTGAVDSGGSPGAYDALVAVDAGTGQMNHTAKQWLKIELTLTASGFSSPAVHRLVANFSTSDIFVSLAILDGLTGADAYEQYAKAVDYETGDNGDGDRFFRSKDPSGDAVIELTQENGIVEVSEYDPGFDQVITLGRVVFDENVEEYDGDDAGESSPTPEEEYGRIPPPGGQLNLTGVLIANDINLAADRARLLYERNSRPKRRIRMTIWAPPWLELGDKIRATVFDDPLVNHIAAVDPLPRAGGGRLSGGAFNVCLANALDMKLLQYKPNWDTGLAEVYAEEILS